MEQRYGYKILAGNSAFALPTLFALNKTVQTYAAGSQLAMTKVTGWTGNT